MLRNFLILTAAGMGGNFIAEKWLLKADPADTNGFVLIAPGIGLDDAVRGGAFALVAILLHKFLPGAR